MTSLREVGAEVIGERNSRLIFLSGALDSIGNGLAPTALAFGVLSQGYGASALAIIIGVRSVSSLAAYPFAGVLADTRGRRQIAVASTVTLGLAATGWSLLFFGALGWFWLVCACAVLNGASYSLFQAAMAALAPNAIGRDKMIRVLPLYRVLRSISLVAGASLGGLLVAWQGSGPAFAVDAATFFVCAALRSRISEPARTVTTVSSVRAFGVSLRQGVDAFFSLPWLWRVSIQSAVFNAVVFSYMQAGAPAFFSGDAHGALLWGIGQAAQTVGSIAGGYTLIRLTPGRPLVLAQLGALAMLLPIGVIWFSAPVPVVAATMLVAGIGLECSSVSLSLSMQLSCPDDALSRVYAVDAFLAMSLIPFGSFALGAALDAWSYSQVAGSVLAVGLGSVVVALLARSVRQYAYPQ